MITARRRRGGLQQYHSKTVEGMTAHGYKRTFAESVFEQIKGFSE